MYKAADLSVIGYRMSMVTMYSNLENYWNLLLEYSTSSKASKQQFLSLKCSCNLLNTYKTVRSNRQLTVSWRPSMSLFHPYFGGDIIFSSHGLLLRLPQRSLVCPKAGSASTWISKMPLIDDEMEESFRAWHSNAHEVWISISLVILPKFALGVFYFSRPKS